MEPTSYEQLTKLLPEIAIAVIFAYVMLKMNASHTQAHEAKTKAFLEETLAFRNTIDRTNASLLSAFEKNAAAFEKNSVTHERLADAVKNNTESTKEMALVIREITRQ